MSTVLLVEDSLTEAEIITRYLHQVGVKVVSAKSGEEAMEKMLNERPDLIVLDVILPGQSGFEICRELKGDPGTVNIPVVICSTKDTEADKLWGNLLGADAYIPKPVDPQEFQQTVRRLMAAAA